MTDSDIFYHQPPPDPSQDNQLWLKLWRDHEQDSFHQLTVHPLLSRFWSELNLPKHYRILVPLCGKSLDMLWLAEQGHEVVGIELSPIAIESFFRENNLKAKKQRIGNFTRWRSGQISIWCGDYFSLTTKLIGCIDAVLDRAALTALPPAIRAEYLRQLISLTQNKAPVLLFTVEDIEKESAQELAAIDQELEDLCEGCYSVQLIHSEKMVLEADSNDGPGDVYSKVYRLLDW